jgi:hypothetical protein
MSFDLKISQLDPNVSPALTDVVAVVIGGVTYKVQIGNLGLGNPQTPWLTDINADGNNLLNLAYVDLDKITIPANPAADHGRLYVKEVDANNDGLFIKIKKGGTIVEVQVA